MVHAKVPNELKKMAADANPDIILFWKSPSLENFIYILKGPKDTIYEGAFFKIHCHIPSEYPFKPPMMQFMTKIWHPNISSVTGAICLDILKDKWSPAMNMCSCLLSIQAMLTAAVPDDPQDGVVAEQYINRHNEFEDQAREWVKLYAQEGMITEKEIMINNAVARGKKADYVHTYLSTNHWNDKKL